MTSDQKKKTIIGVIGIAVLLLIVVALSGQPKQAPQDNEVVAETSAPISESVPEAASAPVTEPVPAVETETSTTSDEQTSKPAKLSNKGQYDAECIIGGGSTMIGRVEVGKGKDPAKEKTISIQNRNTGKATKVDMAEAQCTFTPVK